MNKLNKKFNYTNLRLLVLPHLGVKDTLRFIDYVKSLDSKGLEDLIAKVRGTMSNNGTLSQNEG